MISYKISQLYMKSPPFLYENHVKVISGKTLAHRLSWKKVSVWIIKSLLEIFAHTSLPLLTAESFLRFRCTHILPSDRLIQFRQLQMSGFFIIHLQGNFRIVFNIAYIKSKHVPGGTASTNILHALSTNFLFQLNSSSEIQNSTNGSILCHRLRLVFRI